MKKLISLVVLLVGVVFLTANITAAQSTNTNARSQEQSLQDLVNEVRQLRAMLQRVNVTVYKTNIVMERMKLQQDLVSRQARDLDDVREKLGETRTEIMKMKEVVKSGESGVAAGTANPEVVAKFKLELEEGLQREQRLVMRESQLINELSMARNKLAELNSRLDLLETEIK